MKKKISVITVCTVIAAAVMIVAGLGMFTSAEEDYKTRYGITYEELFMEYPTYLDNAETEQNIAEAKSAYMSVIAEYDTEGVFVAA